MTKLLYCNVNEIADQDLQRYAAALPAFMVREVMRYRYLVDRKARLLARLMLWQALQADGKPDLIFKCKRNHHNKPFIEGWQPFNISHSGEMVVFCQSHHNIGVDIEKMNDLDYLEMKSFFHWGEQEFIERSADRQQAFYEIWVKKEAFLKAVGIGIVNGLATVSCVNEKVHYHERDWYLHRFHIHPGYTAYYCSSGQANNLIIDKFHLPNTTR